MKRTDLGSVTSVFKSLLCRLQPVTLSEPQFLICKGNNSSLDGKLPEGGYTVSCSLRQSQGLKQCLAQGDSSVCAGRVMIGGKTQST